MADLTPIQLYSNSAGDSVANLDVPSDGEIKGIMLVIAGSALDSEDDKVQAEVSFGSTSQFTVNDSRSVIMTGEIRATVGTDASVAKTSEIVAFSFGGDGIPVAAGERLHLHIVRSTGVSSEVRVLMYMRLRGAGRALPRRSR